MTPQTPPTDRPLTAGELEQIAHNLCSLHDFDAAIVAGLERFAKAVITEYERARPATSAASKGAFSVDDLAQEIRRVDGNHSLGAGALAEALMPFLAALASTSAASEPVWRDVRSAPQDGSLILLNHRTHGIIQGCFSKGEWSDDTPISPREYSGDMWVLGDDLHQDEVEFGESGVIVSGSVTGWMPLAALASPPVSERERELEGALREIEAMCPATCETSLAHDMAQIASEALTAQPAGEGK